MGRESQVRWYRGGSVRWVLAILSGLLGLLLGAEFISQGVMVPADRSELITGVAILVIAAMVVTLALRAGFGAGADHLMVRGADGRTRKIPWSSITRFEIGRPRGWRNDGVIMVVCADGRGWHTSGCTAGRRIRQPEQMIRALEAERLSRVEGRPVPDPSAINIEGLVGTVLKEHNDPGQV
jgi:hypothetical protein